MRKFSIAVIAVIAGLVSVITSYAQHPGAGTRYFPLLSVDYDARSAAMAGASVAMPNGVNGILSNPASAASIEHVQAFIGYRSMVGIRGGPVSFGRSFGKYGVFAANITGVNSGEIQVLDQNGVETGEAAGVNYVSGGVNWAYNVLNDLSVGVMAKGAYEKMNIPGTSYSAKGAALDAGVYYNMLRGRFTAGAVIRNLFIVLKGFDENDYKNWKARSKAMPLTVEGGISFVPKYIPAMRIALDINKKLGDYINFEPGLELNIYKKTLALRLGYGFSERDFKELTKSLSGDKDEDYIKSNMTSFCLGVGLNTKIEESDLRIDFALQFNTTLPPAMLISALIDF